MKKLIWLLMCIMLCGCATNEPVASVCSVQTTTEGLDIGTQIKLEGTGDLLETYTEVTSIDVSAYDDQQQNEFLETMVENYSGYEGITMSGEIVENIAALTLTVDLEKVDINKLVELGIVSQADSKEFSYKATVEGLTSSGYQCEELNK